VDSDQTIVKHCQAGRSDGFARLLLANQERVYRRAYSFLHHREDALDITQEVFVRTISAIRSFDPGRPVWPWLRRITTNLCLNHLRDRPALLSLELAKGQPDRTAGSDPAEAALAHWDWQQVASAMARLPPLYRMALVLRHQEQLTYEEVARAMDLPLGTVKTYLFRGRQALKELTEERGG